MASEPELTPEDRALLERVARRIVALHMEVPAILTLESLRPMSLVAGQAMVFFEPLARAMFRLPDYRRFASLLERRETLESLARLVENEAEAARARARSGKGGPDPGPKT